MSLKEFLIKKFQQLVQTLKNQEKSEKKKKNRILQVLTKK